MTARQEATRIRSLVVVGSVFGLCIAFAMGVGIAGGGIAPGWQKGFYAVAFCVPFAVALISTHLGSVAHQRVGWTAAAVLSAAVGAATIFSGVGIFYLALAAGFAWAVIASGRVSRRLARA